MPYDDPIGNIETSKIEELDPEMVIERMAEMAAKLNVHEGFVSYLGVGTITVKKLPYAYRVEADWNDNSLELRDIGFYTNDTLSNLVPALRLYLFPALEA